MLPSIFVTCQGNVQQSAFHVDELFLVCGIYHYLTNTLLTDENEKKEIADLVET